MGAFSLVHWIIAAVLLSALAAFAWLAGSFIVAGLRSSEMRGKTIVFLCLLPFVALALYAASVTYSGSNEPTTQPVDDDWWKQDTPVN